MSKKNIIIYSIFALVFIACFVFYSILSKDKKYTNITYNIEYLSDTLFTEKEFSEYVAKVHPSIIGKPIDSVNLSIFEKKIETYPYISNADVINNGGNLMIKATQEKIIAKIFNNKDEQFYLAESGKLVPKSKNTAGRIIIVNGNIDKRYSENYFVYQKDTVSKNKSKTLYIIWKMVCFIEKDSFWKAQISQIYVNKKQEMELIPTIGEHIILFGNVASANNIDEAIKQRFNNLRNLYINGFKITGWNKYKSINLKYGTEIPCEAR
jgi:cell division protein FtsQ